MSINLGSVSVLGNQHLEHCSNKPADIISISINLEQPSLPRDLPHKITLPSKVLPDQLAFQCEEAGDDRSKGALESRDMLEWWS